LSIAPKSLLCFATCEACQALEPPIIATIDTIAQIKSPVTEEDVRHAKKDSNDIATNPANNLLSVQINFILLFYNKKMAQVHVLYAKGPF
jgi:hypothetical protein